MPNVFLRIYIVATHIDLYSREQNVKKSITENSKFGGLSHYSKCVYGKEDIRSKFILKTLPRR